MTKNAYSFHIGVVGAPGSGKTAYINRMIDNQFTAHYSKTIGIEIYAATIILANEQINVRFWEEGHLAFNSHGICFSRQHGFLVMIDVTDSHHYNHLKDWLQNIDRYAQSYRKVIVLGTKCEQIDRRVVNKNEMDLLADNWGFSYIEVSAKDNINISESLLSLLKTLLMYHSNVLRLATTSANTTAQKALIIAAKENYKVLDDSRLLKQLEVFNIMGQRYRSPNLTHEYACALQNNAARIWLLQGSQLVNQNRLPAELFILIASYVLDCSLLNTCEIRLLMSKKLLIDVIEHKKRTPFLFWHVNKKEANAIERYEKRLHFNLN